MSSERSINFSAGPAIIPESVLQKASKEMLNWNNTGMSLMELSHRSGPFKELIAKIEQDLIDLLKIPETHKVLFLQGGAHFMFSGVPLNLMGENGKGDYILTGNWSTRAMNEAKKYGKVNVVCKPDEFNKIPPKEEWNLSTDASYVYYCDNETVKGVEFPDIPDVGDVPLVCDMSSNFLSRPFDVSKFGCVYACAQKNFGMAGLTIAIVRKDLIGKQLPYTPMMLDFELQAKANSMFNTPSTYAIYIAGLIFDWLKEQGGLEEIAKINLKKCKLIYDAIDNSNGFYKSPVEIKSRSRMNIPFVCKNKEWESEWLEGAAKLKLVSLKGHRSVGGFRASIYNAMSYEGCEKLVNYMIDFMKTKEK
ncbi:phosphoserine aminotransferase [Anaeramoeba flamelloides]|uniref:Phosphoserine aminotransferase n=1 Tax=Anaeramoeba flamelloides TaxID=1746091 RepID=A0ABQ8Y4M5_9EUKA|nr:phosphoserine aminotransferase [Anaeramoeba flamelloides]